jgi:hypothetical protein
MALRSKSTPHHKDKNQLKTKVIQLTMSFVMYTTKISLIDRKVQLIVMTGVMRLAKDAGGPPINNTVEYIVLDPTYASFVGFNEKDMQYIFKVFGFTNSITNK